MHFSFMEYRSKLRYHAPNNANLCVWDCFCSSVNVKNDSHPYLKLPDADV